MAAKTVVLHPEGRSPHQRATVQGVLEAVLLIAAGSLFVYEWAESLRLRQGPELLPRIVATTGLVALAIYVIRRLWQLRGPGTGGGRQILDLGMDGAGLARSVLVSRVARFLGSLAFLYLGVWLIGFHLTIPLYLFGYLLLWGEMRWWSAALVAGVYFAIIVGLYDWVLHAPWNDPVIGQFMPLISFR